MAWCSLSNSSVRETSGGTGSAWVLLQLCHGRLMGFAPIWTYAYQSGASMIPSFLEKSLFRTMTSCSRRGL